MCISKCSGYSCTLRGFVSRSLDEPFIINSIYFCSGVKTLAEEESITSERFGMVIWPIIHHIYILYVQKVCSKEILYIGNQ